MSSSGSQSIMGVLSASQQQFLRESVQTDPVVAAAAVPGLYANFADIHKTAHEISQSNDGGRWANALVHVPVSNIRNNGKDAPDNVCHPQDGWTYTAVTSFNQPTDVNIMSVYIPIDQNNFPSIELVDGHEGSNLFNDCGCTNFKKTPRHIAGEANQATIPFMIRVDPNQVWPIPADLFEFTFDKGMIGGGVYKLVRETDPVKDQIIELLQNHPLETLHTLFNPDKFNLRGDLKGHEKKVRADVTRIVRNMSRSEYRSVTSSTLLELLEQVNTEAKFSLEPIMSSSPNKIELSSRGAPTPFDARTHVSSHFSVRAECGCQ